MAALKESDVKTLLFTLNKQKEFLTDNYQIYAVGTGDVAQWLESWN